MAAVFLPGAALFHILDDGDGECTLEDIHVRARASLRRLFHNASLRIDTPLPFLNAPHVAKACCFKMVVRISHSFSSFISTYLCLLDVFLVQMLGVYSVCMKPTI